jgi:hypothetical protein
MNHSRKRGAASTTPPPRKYASGSVKLAAIVKSRPSVAVSWVALGVVADLGHPWATTAATLLFGAAHSTVAPRAVNGRHGSDRLSVRAEVAGRHVTALVLGGLVLLVGVTIAASLALHADGAKHPVTAASVLVAVTVLLGGPLLLSWVRQAARTAGNP